MSELASSLEYVCVMLAVVFAWLTIHPFVTYPLSLWILRAIIRPRTNLARTHQAPLTVAIVFCAYNEEAILHAKLKNLRDIRHQLGTDRVSVLAYCDASCDGTLTILESASDEVVVFSGKARVGKSAGMNTLLNTTQADVVVFTDANVLLAPEAIPAMIEEFLDPDIGVVCGRLKYVNADTPTAAVGAAYWSLEERLKSLETETGSVMGADGSLFAIRRKLFRPVPPDIIDDFFTSLSILCDGYRVVSCPGALAFECATRDSQQEYLRKVRIACRAMNCHQLLWPRLKTLSWLNLYKYVSHKLIRWLSLLWIVGMLAVGSSWFMLRYGPTAYLIILLIGFTVVGVSRGLAALGLKVFRKIFDAVAAILATAEGVWRSLCGQRFQTWTPPSSTRTPLVTDNS